MLCDRFADRLKSLLEELPRDFFRHFCSRWATVAQRNRPMVNFSSQIGIPTLYLVPDRLFVVFGRRSIVPTKLPVEVLLVSWALMFITGTTCTVILLGRRPVRGGRGEAALPLGSYVKCSSSEPSRPLFRLFSKGGCWDHI
jgi:hypothetical protein